MRKTCKAPPPPDTPETSRKKLFWKLAYAKESFTACKRIVEQYISDIKVDSHPYYYAFVSSLCITYARAFTHGEGVGQLPRRYFRFPNKSLRTTHHTLIRSRHQLYAHNDASVAMYKVVITAAYDGTNVTYGYGPGIPMLRGVIFADVLELCEFQMARAGEELAPILPELWPPQTILRMLHAENSESTNFVLKW